MKKVMALLLVLPMLFAIIAGCSETDEQNESIEPTTANTAKPDSDNDKPENTPEEAEEADEGTLKLPIVDEKITVTAFWPVNNFQAQVTTSLNDLVAFQELEDRTNIHVEYKSPPYGEEQTTFNLMVVSGIINDIMNVPQLETWYAGGATQAVEEGVVLDLTDLIPQYAVNCWAELQKDPIKMKQSKNDEGKILGMPGISILGPEPAWGGLVIRRDLLEKQGLGLPVTIDDWDEALTVFKDVYGAEAPLIMPNNEGYFMSGEFASTYDAHHTFLQIDGEVRFGPMEDGWKSYIELMKDWYERGLLDRDFTGRDVGTDFWRKGLLGTGKACAAWNAWGNTANRLYAEGISEDPDFYLAAVNNPRRDENTPTHIRLQSDVILNPVYVSATSDNIPEIIKWLDYFYTDDGLILSNYGIENESYTMVNGSPQLTDMLLDQSEGAWELNLAKWTMYSGPGFYDYKRNWQAYDTELIEACNTWNSDDDSYCIPAKITRTPAENTEYSLIMSEVNTYVFEITCRMIVGTTSIDEWDTYINTIKDMDIDRAIEIQQLALDRYNTR